MTKQQLSAAWALARSGADLPDYFGPDMAIFEGCALPGAVPFYCTIEQVASLFRAHCTTIFGEVTLVEFDDIARNGRRLFQIV